MAIQTAAGWNNAGALATLTIAPQITLPEPGRVRQGGDLLVYRDGAYRQIWRYGYLTETNYPIILTACGVATAESAKMTVRTLGRGGAEANWNAVIIRPPAPEFYGGLMLPPLDFTIMLIEAL